jgi:hypothetical protein
MGRLRIDRLGSGGPIERVLFLAFVTLASSILVAAGDTHAACERSESPTWGRIAGRLRTHSHVIEILESTKRGEPKPHVNIPRGNIACL